MSIDILAPPNSRDVSSDLAAEWIAYLSGHLNLVVPVVTAIIVIFTALITICALRRGKNDSIHKGNSKSLFNHFCLFFFCSPLNLDAIAPARNNDNGRAQLLELFPWLPEFVDYNMLIAGLAMVVIIVVGIAVICVAVSRRNRGPESVRLRGFCVFPLHFFLFLFILQLQQFIEDINNMVMMLSFMKKKPKEISIFCATRIIYNIIMFLPKPSSNYPHMISFPLLLYVYNHGAYA